MEPCAFNAMMEQYEKLVYTVCLRLVHDEHLAQDLTQETFLSAWVHRSACPDGAQKAWLCRIAANKAKDHLKSAWARRTQLTDFAAEGTACTAPACTESLAAPPCAGPHPGWGPGRPPGRFGYQFSYAGNSFPDGKYSEPFLTAHKMRTCHLKF